MRAGPEKDLISQAPDRAAGVRCLQLKLAENELLFPNGQPAPHRRVDVIYLLAVLGEYYAKVVDHHRVFVTCDSPPFEAVMARCR